MNSTEVRDDHRQIMRDRAIGYSEAEGGYLEAFPKTVHGPGNIVSSPTDLLIWNEAITTERLGRFLTAELHREAKAADGRPLRYGRGIMLRRYRGIEEIGHDGGTAGGTAILVRYPAQRLAIAVACNTGFPSPLIARKVADLYLTGTVAEAAPAPAAVTAPATRLAEATRLTELQGTFFDSLRGIRVNLKVQDGTLMWNDGPLELISPDRFRAPPFTVVFRGRNSIEYTSTESGEKRSYSRIDGPVPTPAQLAALVGNYRSAEIKTTYQIILKDGKLSAHLVDGPHFEWELEPLGPDAFNAYGNTFRVIRNGSGAAIAFTFSNGRLRELRFDRLPTSSGPRSPALPAAAPSPAG
jgi:hypothetical protein